MVDPNTRQGKRTPVTLKIKFKSETLEQFIERYAVDVSQGGIFIRTKEPLAVGTQMRFEFQLRDASPLIGGEGTVVWTRENDPSRPAIAPGMGVRFDRLAEGSQSVLERILSDKAKQAPSRGSEPTKPPMFTDTPTRVAPMPVQEALLGNEQQRRKRPDSFGGEGTPLPQPMPFHSDADEFPEEAFEEATKVRALDELIAQTATAEAAKTRVDATITDPPRADTQQPTAVNKPAFADRDSAPVLPSPPEHARPAPRLLDTTPSPRTEEPSAPVAAVHDSSKTRLGLEPAVKSPPRASAQMAAVAPPADKLAPTKPTGMRAAAAEPAASKAKMPAAPAPQKSAAPMIILLLLLVAAGGAAVWFFVLREKAEKSVAGTSAGSGTVVVANNGGGSGSDTIKTGSGSNTLTSGSGSDATAPGSNGSADPSNSGSGSAVAMTGSNAAGSNAGTTAGSNAAGSNAGTTAGSNAGTTAGSNAGTTAGSNAGTTAPPVEVNTETVISSSIPRASVQIVGTTFSGVAPFRVRLPKGKVFTARVTAAGYAPQEVAFKGGDARAMARLEPKPRSIAITTDPAGAMIFIDNANSGFTTPYTLELSTVQIAKKAIRVTLRKNGFKTFEKMVDVGAYADDGAKMTAKINEQLPVQVQLNTPTNTNGGTPTGSGSGSAAPPGTGSGSALKDPGATISPPGTSLKDGPKEPEPDFAK